MSAMAPGFEPRGRVGAAGPPTVALTQERERERESMAHYKPPRTILAPATLCSLNKVLRAMVIVRRRGEGCHCCAGATSYNHGHGRGVKLRGSANRERPCAH